MPSSPVPFVQFPAPIPQSDPSWNDVRSFLRSFHDSIICYIPDADSIKKNPVVHSVAVDLDKQEEGYGIFYSVNGFPNADSRESSKITSLNAVYVDIDWPKGRLGPPTPEALSSFKSAVLQDISGEAFEEGGLMPSYIVETKNGYHVLWCFDEPILIDNADAATRQNTVTRYLAVLSALIDRYNGDDGAKDLTRVLRLPNTWHLKNPQFPFLVKITQSTGNTFSLEQLERRFLSEAQKQIAEKTTARFRNVDASGLLWNSAVNKPIPKEAFEELNRVYPKMDRPSYKRLLQKDGIPEGTRADSLFIAASGMRESGKTYEEVLSYFDRYSNLPAYQIESTIKSAFKTPEPFSFGWNNSILARYVTEEEKAIVRGVVGKFMGEQKDAERQEKKKESTHTQADSGIQVDEKTVAQSLFRNYERIICERFPYIRCADDGEIFEYENGVYVLRDPLFVRNLFFSEMLKDKMDKFRTRSHVADKIACLQSLNDIRVHKEDMNSNANILNVKNGLLDITTGKISPHTPAYFSTAMVKATYREERVEDIAPRWVQFIDEIMDGEDREGKKRFLKQIAGYCLTCSVEYQKAFIFIGGGSNGKSTFLKMLQKLLGNESVSVSLDDLLEKFGPIQLFGKRLNVIEEISNNYFESDKVKKIISGEEITADRKFTDPITFRPFAKIVFAVNQLPKINDTTMGLYRRFHILEFLASFEGREDPTLERTLEKEIDGILLWCVEGLIDLQQNKGFCVPESTKIARDLFKEANSNIVEFLLKEYIIDEHAVKIPAEQVFEKYRNKNIRLNQGVKSYQNFIKEIQSLNHSELKGVRLVKISREDYIEGLIDKEPIQNLVNIHRK